jgi:hypothetical protein
MSDNFVFDAHLIKKTCNVKYYHLVPLNLEDCPFIVIISKGIHEHPPPPPVKTPPNILMQLQNILNGDDILNLTARKLLTRLYQFYYKFFHF